MVEKKKQRKQKTLLIRLPKAGGCGRRTLATKSVCSLLLWVASLVSVSCVSEKRMVNLESSLNDTRETFKNRNEELGETQGRLSRIEKSWDRLNAQVLTVKMMCEDLQQQCSRLSEQSEKLELNSADSDLEIFNRMRELKEQQTENNMKILTKVKELRTQLENFKGVPNDSIAAEVLHLKARVDRIENGIEDIQRKLSGDIEIKDKNAQESPYDAIKDVMNRFDKHYGGPQMDKITEVTTARFRENRPGAVWVSEIWKALDELGYKRLNSVVIESEIKRNKARVVLESEIQTKAGETQQTEVFHLIWKEGGWRIDELVVADDKTDLSPLH